MSLENERVVGDVRCDICRQVIAIGVSKDAWMHNENPESVRGNDLCNDCREWRDRHEHFGITQPILSLAEFNKRMRQAFGNA